VLFDNAVVKTAGKETDLHKVILDTTRRNFSSPQMLTLFF